MSRTDERCRQQEPLIPVAGTPRQTVSRLIPPGRQTLIAFGGLLSVAVTGADEVCAEPAALNLSGSVRVRQELIQGQIRAGASLNNTLTSVRTRIAAKLGDDPLYAEAEIIDSRAYFYERDTPVGSGEVNTVELVQASLNSHFKLADAVPVNLKAGRFALNLG